MSERRKKKVRLTLGKLERAFFLKPLKEVSKDDLESFVLALKNDGLSEEFTEF
ncbi:MAG: hypothetical protein JRN20_00945 [Nitrososphaerota archaeon]|nr:hypothetical protein [Nitrososphaerota archaeon]